MPRRQEVMNMERELALYPRAFEERDEQAWMEVHLHYVQFMLARMRRSYGTHLDDETMEDIAFEALLRCWQALKAGQHRSISSEAWLKAFLRYSVMRRRQAVPHQSGWPEAEAEKVVLAESAFLELNPAVTKVIVLTSWKSVPPSRKEEHYEMNSRHHVRRQCRRVEVLLAA